MSYLLDLNTPLTQVLGEFEPGGETWNLLGLDVIAQQKSFGGWQYLHTDGLGSVRAISDDNGLLTHAADYSPYGTPLATLSDSPSSFGFTGEMTDPTGLTYLRARYYHPASGTFISQDPVLGVVGGPASTFNPYLYVRGNPVNWTDPSGEFLPLLLLAGAAIGALAGAAMDLVAQLAANKWNIDCIDLGSVLKSAILGAISGMAGALLGAAGIAGWQAFALGGMLDFGVGMAYDVGISKMSAEDALLNNAMGFVFGGVAEMGGNALGRAFRKLSGAVDDINVKPSMRNSVDADADMPGTVCPIGNSFSAETTVVVPDGETAISELVVGDTVIAYNEATGETGEYVVTDTISHTDHIVVALVIDGETLTTTPEHPFYTTEGEWVNAGDLDIGDVIRALDGSSGTVESVAFFADPQPMYNLTVDEAHTFFVGAGEWLVHNTCRPWQYTENPPNRLHPDAPMRGDIGAPNGKQRAINHAYAGQNYQLSGELAEKYPLGVDFDNQGFPIFDRYEKARVTIKMTGTDEDFRLAEQAYNPTRKRGEAFATAPDIAQPLGYTWHHLQDGNTMQLVPSDLHEAVRHTGGTSVTTHLP